MPNLTYAGLDLSYGGLGIALYRPADNKYVVETLKFPAAKAGTGMPRLIRIADQVLSSLTIWQSTMGTIDGIAVEGYAPGSTYGREMAGELRAAVLLRLLQTQTYVDGDFTIVSPTGLKKFVTGKGNATKDQMMLAAFKKWGVEFKDNDQCDAYALARVASTKTGHGPRLGYEKEVLDKLTWGTT